MPTTEGDRHDKTSSESGGLASARENCYEIDPHQL